MRKLFSAGVLITAATAAMLVPSAAQAEPDEAEWTFVEDYFHLADCQDAGEAGLREGEWEAFDCEFEVVPGDWSLYALVDDDNGEDDGGDDGGDNGGSEEEDDD